MLRAKQMSRLLIAASRDQMQAVIRELYRQHICHIEDFVEDGDGEGFRIGMPLADADEISSKLIKIRAIKNTFGLSSEDLPVELKRSARDLRALVDQDLPAIQEDVEALVGRRQKLEAALREHEQRIKELTPFTAVPIDLGMYRGYAGFSVFTGRIAGDVEISAPHERFFSDTVPSNFIAVITPNDYREEVEKDLLEARFQAVPVPDEEGSAQSCIETHAGEAARIREELALIQSRITEMKTRYSEFLAACDELLTSEVEQAEVPLRFATSDESFLIEGWVLADKVAGVRESLDAVTGGRVFVTELEVTETARVPVEYDNPSFAQPSELLMDTYSRPKYDELDPTAVLAIIFPVFFGIILGDAGYGLILLAASWGLGRFITSDAAGRLLTVLRNASISSIIFGMLYSEVLGFALPWEPIIFSRHLNIGAHATGHGPEITGLLILAVWIGIAQISLGRVLNAINHHHHHEVRGVAAQLGWLAAMWGILILLWSMAPIPYMPDLTGMAPVVAGLNGGGVAGALICLAGIAGIACESALELVELPTIISHTMSYTRLVAVGLSSVAIAMVVNYIAIGMLIGPQLEHFSALGIVLIIMGVLVFILGHALNTALGLLGGGLHSIRLQYVEFFTKFYKGGGIKFNPFGIKSKFLED